MSKTPFDEPQIESVEEDWPVDLEKAAVWLLAALLCLVVWWYVSKLLWWLTGLIA